MVVLENSAGLSYPKHREFLELIVECAEAIRMKSGTKYTVEWKVMNSLFYSLPQNRKRLYFVMLRQDVQQHPLCWPKPHTEKCRQLDMLLDPPDRCINVRRTMPTDDTDTAIGNIVKRVQRLQDTGKKPFTTTYCMDIDSSDGYGGCCEGFSPCLTASRASSGGHYVTTRARRQNTPEMCRLQAMQPHRLKIPAGVPLRKFHFMLGNAVPVNMVEIVLTMINDAAPGVLSRGPLIDKWSNT
jgi:site-specific DNA-cytosine methylase